MDSGLEPHELLRRRSILRAWFLSPAVATVIFFVAQIFLSVMSPSDDAAVAGAGADAPTALPVSVRVVHSIRAAEDGSLSVALVPQNEAAFLDLFKRDPAVVFRSDEVEAVLTPSREFDAGEVGVIKLRRAKLAKPRQQ